MNSYSEGKTGGDMVFVKIAAQLSDFSWTIVTSALGKALCESYAITANYLVTTSESQFGSVIETYSRRIFLAFRLAVPLVSNTILLGTSDFLPDVLPIIWLKFRNRNKKIFWVQHIFHLIPSTRRLSFFAQRLSIVLIKRYADVIVVDNTLLVEDLVTLGISRDKLVVNYPGIDSAHLLLVARQQPPQCEYDAIFLGQLRESKGVFDLIKIWQGVCEKFPKASLGIIGKGSEDLMVRLRAEIAVSGMANNIHTHGFLPDACAYSLVKASKVFVLLSSEEGFGVAPLEAQTLGIPVIAWNLPAFAEVFPQGMLQVTKGDFDAFIDSVVNLLKDTTLRKHLAEEALQNSKRFSWVTTARIERTIFENLLGATL